MSRPPDRKRALEQYRERVHGYDRHMWFARATHREAVERLELERGQIVLDVACGTGINFPAIQERIGPEGTLIGLDLSPEMLAAARERTNRARWDNVTLIEAAAEDAELPFDADAALFAYTHDVLQSRKALERLFGAIRTNARVVSTGGKWPPRWLVPVHAFVRWQAPRYVTTMDGFDRPWTLLAEYVPDIDVEPRSLGAAYMAWGRAR